MYFEKKKTSPFNKQFKVLGEKKLSGEDFRTYNVFLPIIMPDNKTSKLQLKMKDYLSRRDILY